MIVKYAPPPHKREFIVLFLQLRFFKIKTQNALQIKTSKNLDEYKIALKQAY